MNECSNNDKKNYNKLYFTKKYKKNIDAMLYAFFIDADYENKTPYTILSTNNEMMNIVRNLFVEIKQLLIKFINDITKLSDVFRLSVNSYIFKEAFKKYKVLLNSFVKDLDLLLYNHNKYCNYKVYINNNISFIPEIEDYLPYYELNMGNKNIKICHIMPSFNIIFNPSTLKLELILKDKKDDIVYYKFLITPPINIKFRNINKKEFCNILSEIKNFKTYKNSDIGKIFTYIDDQISYLPLKFF